MTPIQWIILSAVILAVTLLLVLAVLLIGWQNRRRGVDGKKKVAAILRRFTGIRSFRVLTDLTIHTAKKDVTIDHVLIGFFGILVVNTQNLPGSVYGDGRGKTWTHVITKRAGRSRPPSPIPFWKTSRPWTPSGKFSPPTAFTKSTSKAGWSSPGGKPP